MVRGKRQALSSPIQDTLVRKKSTSSVAAEARPRVLNGDTVVKKGDQLTDGPVVPHDLLEILGPHVLQ